MPGAVARSVAEHRSGWAILALLLVGLVMLAAAGPAVARPARKDTRSERLAGSPLFGVNADLLSYPQAELDQVLDRMASAQISIVRVPLRWAELETRPNQPDLTALDHVVSSMAARGMTLHAVLTTAPAWTRKVPAPTPPPGMMVCDDPRVTGAQFTDRRPPDDPADLASFASTVARRYSSTLGALEVWDEPNLLPNWGPLGPDPEAYAALLATVAQAVKRSAPGVLVISAGLAPTTDLGVCGFSDVVFLDRVARQGALVAVDAIGIKPFGLRAAPDEGPADREVLNFRRAEVLHGVLAKNKVGRPLWAVAWGWHHPVGPAGSPASDWGDIDPLTVSRWTAEAWTLARRDWPWLGPMLLWTWQPPRSVPADDQAWGYALIGPDGQPSATWPIVESIASAASGSAASAAESTNGSPPRDQTASAPTQSSAGLAPASLVSERLSSSLARRTLLSMLALFLFVLLWLPAVRRRLAPVLGRPLAWLAAHIDPRLGFAAGIAIGLILPGWLSLLGAFWCIAMGAIRPDVALGALGIGLPLYYALNVRLGPVPMDVAEYLVWLLVGAVLLREYIWNGIVRRRLHHLDWAVLALVIFAGLSPLWSEWRWVAAREWRTVILEPALVYAVLRTSPKPAAWAQRALDGLVMGAVVASLWALGEMSGVLLGVGGTVVRAEGVLRANGPYASPNNLALVLGRVLPYLGAAWLFGRSERRRWVILAALPIGAALLATFSRGALMLGLPAAVLCLAAIWLADHGFHWGRGRTRRLVGVAIGAVLVIAVVLAPFAGTERIRRSFSLQPGSTAFVRLHVWSATVDMIRDHPWLGVGLDNFLPLYRDRYVHREVVQERTLNHPHNALLDWTVRLGLPGLVLFLTLVLGNLRAGRLAVQRAKPGGAAGPTDEPSASSPPDPPGQADEADVKSLAAGALAMQVYALAHGLIDNSFFLVDLATLWFMAQAALLAADGRRVVGSADEDRA